MLHKLGLCFVVCGSVLATSVTSAATFSDDFGAYPDSFPLADHTAATGQEWGPFTLFPVTNVFHINPSYSTTGSPAAGGGAGASGGGNSVPLGTALVAPFIMQVDFENPGQFNDAQFWLSDMANGRHASLYWDTDNARLGFEGLSVPAFFMNTGITNNNSLHVSLQVDPGAHTVQVSWFDNNDPADPATTGTSSFSYSSGITYNPDTLHLYRNVANGVAVSSFDNVHIDAVPEPASLAVLGMAGLGLMRCRRRA